MRRAGKPAKDKEPIRGVRTRTAMVMRTTSILIYMQRLDSLVRGPTHNNQTLLTATHHMYFPLVTTHVNTRMS